MNFLPGKVPADAFRTQSGMVLLLCLIFLMSLTLLGLSAASDTILQNKLSANLQEAERARQSALLALAWAEQWLLELDGPAPESCLVPCVGVNLHAKGDLPPHPESENFSWWMTHGQEAGIDPVTGERTTTISSNSLQPPLWVIATAQIIPSAESGNPDLQIWYRIMARGSGRTDKAISVIESTVVRSWPSDPDIPGRCGNSEGVMACGRYAWRELR